MDSINPSTVNRVAPIFGREWWAMSAPQRFASLAASQAGLEVTVELAKPQSYYKEIPLMFWRGTADQFHASGYFPDGLQVTSKNGRRHFSRPVMGRVYPDGLGRFKFIIDGEHVSARDRAKHAIAAKGDSRYAAFRSNLLDKSNCNFELD